MRYQILTNLPKKKYSHTEKEVIDRKAMVGLEVDLLYKGEQFKIKIMEYIGGKIPKFKVEYKNTISEINCSCFMAGQLGRVLGKHSINFKVNIGDEFIDNKRHIIITDREYRKHKQGHDEKWYKYKCDKCGWHEGWIRESCLLSGKGCSCCAGRTVVEDINSIWTTDRWMCDLGLSEKDAKIYCKSSGKNVIVVCPNCGKTKKMIINTIYNERSIACSCGDGVKYPEKFMTSVLEQLNIEYVFQLTKKSFYWCEDKRYDFYIPSLNTIIETHGRQHYEDCGWSKAKDVQENDRIKYELALQNGIGGYIVIDCRKSNKEHIKNSIVNSELNKIYDLSKINWSECEEFALKSNIVKEVCEYWNDRQEWETTKALAEIFGLSREAIIDYLKKGAGLGWCEYDAKEEKIKNGKLNGKANGRRVAMYDLNGNFIMEGFSAHEIARRAKKEMGLSLGVACICKVCRGKQKSHKGFVFKYVT